MGPSLPVVRLPHSHVDPNRPQAAAAKPLTTRRDDAELFAAEVDADSLFTLLYFGRAQK